MGLIALLNTLLSLSFDKTFDMSIELKSDFGGFSPLLLIVATIKQLK